MITAGESPADDPIIALGRPVPWTAEELLGELREFLLLYNHRPLRDNEGGMKSVGMFNLWFLLRRLSPDFVIESGIWHGQSTWLIENALPHAAILSLDIDLGLRRYISPRAQYLQQDFLTLDLKRLGISLGGTLAMFDDHQHAAPRLAACLDSGIHHVILDDNYPHMLPSRHVSAAACLNDRTPSGAPAFPAQRRWLMDHVATYHLFPPLFDPGPVITDETPLRVLPSVLGPFDPTDHAGLEIFAQDLPSYRWTTYLELR
jgi:hypothetical protein